MAEEFKIRLGVELDPNASNNINTQIKNIKINPIPITINDKDVGSKLTSITDQINKIQTTPIQLQMNDRTVLNQLENIRHQIQALGNITINLGGSNNGIGNSVAGMQRAFREVANLYKQIKSMEEKVGKLGMSGLDANNITLYNKQLNILRNTYNQLIDSLNGQNVNLDLVFTDINDARTAITTLSSVIDNARTKLASEIKINIDNGKLEDKIQVIEQRFNKLNTTNTNVTNNLNELRRLLGAMNSTDNVEQITANYRQFNQVLETTTTQVNGLTRQHTEEQRRQKEAIKQTAKELENLSNVAKRMEGLNLEIGKLKIAGGKENEIKALETTLASVEKEYNELIASFNFNNPNLTIEDFTKLNAIFEKTQNTLAQFKGKAKDVKVSLANAIQTDITNGTLSNNIQSVEHDFNKLGITNDNVTNKIAELKKILSTMDGSDDIESVIVDYDKFKQTLITVTNEVKELKRQQADAQRQQKADIADSVLKRDRNAWGSRMDVWLADHSAAAKQFGGQIQSLKARLVDCDRVELNNIIGEFKEIIRQAKLADKATLTFADRLKRQAKRISAYFSIYTVISYTTRALRSMYDNVVKVDTAMTSLYRVTNLTASQYEELYDRMTISAKKYGIALSDIIESTADWAKLGFDTSTAAQLAEITTMYQHVTDLSNDVAVENLVTAYKGFQEQLLELYNGDEAAAVEYVADIFNNLGNKYALAAEDVGAALTRSASALNLAGNTIQESAAMVVGITEVTQDPEKAGSALKILSLRLRGMKGQLQELGEEIDENVESISKMQTQILNFTGGEINIFNDDGSFKSTYEIMDSIAEIFDKLSDTDRADLLETIAGKNRANDVAALIKNWNQVEAAMKSATEAEGSISAENEKYMKSIRGHLAKLTASWQTLSNTIVESEFVKALITALTSLVNVLDFVIDKAGMLPTLLGTIVGITAFKGSFSILTTFDTQLTGVINKLGIFGKSFKDIQRDMQNGQGIITSFFNNLVYKNGITKKDVGYITDFMKEIKNGVPVEQAWNNTMTNASAAGKKMAMQVKSGAVELNTLTKSANTSKIAMVGLKIATAALNVALTMALSIAISKIIEGITWLCTITKRAREEAIKAGEEAVKNAENIYDLTTAYIELSNAVENNTGSSKDLISKQNEIQNALKLTDEKVKTLTGDYIELRKSILEAAITQIGNDVATATIGANKAKETAESELSKYYNQNGKIYNAGIDNAKITNDIVKMFEEYGVHGGGTIDAYLYLPNNATQVFNYTTPFDDLLENYQVLQKMLSYASDKYGVENDVVKDLDNLTKIYEKHLEPVLTSIQDANKLVAQLELTKMLSSKELPDNIEEYTSYRSELIKEIGDNKNFDDLGGYYSIEDIADLVLSENAFFEEIASEYEVQETHLKEIAAKREVVLEKLFGKDATQDNQTLISNMSDEDIEIAYSLIDNTDYSSFDRPFDKLQADIEERKAELKESGKISFSELIVDDKDKDDDFIDIINSNLEKVKTLKDTLEKIQKDEFTDGDFVELITIFPELTYRKDDLDVAIVDLLESMKTDVMSEVGKQSENLKTDEDKIALGNFGNAISEIFNDAIPKTKISFSELMEDDKFIEDVDTYTEKVKTLKDILEKIQKDEFTDVDAFELGREFGIFADNTDDYRKAIIELLKTTNTDMMSKFGKQFGRLDTDEDVEALENFMDATLKLGEVVGDTQFAIDISAESEGMDSLFTAMKESVSSTGLTAKSIKALKARYQDLEGYDPARLFEETTNGIRLNTDALNDLEDAYEKQTKNKLNDTLKDLKKEYNELSDEIKSCDDVVRQAELYAQQKDIVNQINEVATLASQYKGLASAYHKWEEAQSVGNDRDMYEGIISGKEELEEEMSLGWMDDDSVAYLELLTGLDLSNSTATIEDQIAAYKQLGKTINSAGYSVWDFFTVDKDGNANSEGVYNFFDTVRAEFGETAAWVDENNNYHFDFSTVGGDKVIADALGISEELVQIILRAAEDASFKIHLESSLTELADLKTSAEEANEALINIGKTNIKFNFDTTDADVLKTQIEDAQTLFNNLVNTDGTLNVDVSEEDYENAKIILTTLIAQKQQLNAPSIMAVNTEQAKTDIESVIALLQNYQTNYNNLEINAAVGADTSSLETDLQTKITEIQNLSPKVKASLGLDNEAFQTACNNVTANIQAGVTPKQEDLDTINKTIAAITPEMMVKAGLDASLIDGYKAPTDKECEVKMTVNDTEVREYNPPTKYGTIIYKSKSGTQFDAVAAEVDGTAYAQGTVGKAYTKGDWGIKDSGVALGGELGTEILVRNGKWMTIGDNGAEFFNYKRGDIIFNHKQAEELFKYGKVTSNGGRGNAFAEGTAFVKGFESTAYDYGSNGSGGGRVTISGSVTKKKKKSSGSSDDEFKEIFDWIEVAIDRIERAISRLDTKANSTYRSWSKRNDNLKKEISKVGEEIDLQQKAYDRYMKQADSVGLDESWAKKVREGKIDIETIKDEKLAEKINEYQTWVDKAYDARDAIVELRETEVSLYQQVFDNIVTQYDGFLSIIEHERNMLEEYISQSEASGHIVSTKYYDALINVEKANIAKLEDEKEALLTSLEEAVNSGTIKPDSESWVEMVNAIDEVTQSITEANTSLIEMNNNIRDIEWSIFDLLQEQISQVAEEADFLIELLSNDKLYDDRGQLTDEGMTTMGLHGQNYNTYMYQADKYAEEMLEINKKLADDPYNQDLVERRQELLELQQDMILAAESEKNAIVDMVKEGVELELESLSELIEKYTEALDSQRDLYDYQKKISNSTKEIASLEKQMFAYQNDTSEETKSKIQQLKVSLEEANQNLEEQQYDRYISDSKKLLDELYIEYEETLNARFDNIDLLIADMIDKINTNASTINSTLSSKADEVGYTLSSEMKTTWDTSTSNITTVLTTYGQGIQDGIATVATTLNTALSTFNVNIQNMVSKLNTSASSNVQSATISSAAYSSQAQSNIYTPSTAINASSSNSASSSSNSSSSISKESNKKSNKKSDDSKKSDSNSSNKKSDNSNKSSSNNNIFDYKKDSYPKSKLNVSESIVDRLKYSNYNSSFASRSDYYNEMGFKGTYTGSAKQNVQMLDWMKKNGYRMGKYKLSKDELAWTQEGRELEAIIRPSDGAILTPLVQNDSVLKASATSNIFNFANDPSGFIRDNLNITSSISDTPSQNVVGGTYDNDFNIQIELPNVTNYEQFKHAMQHDKSFEKMVRAMTVDKMFGGSSLKKYKY